MNTKMGEGGCGDTGLNTHNVVGPSRSDIRKTCLIKGFSFGIEHPRSDVNDNPRLKKWRPSAQITPWTSVSLHKIKVTP